MNTFIRKVALAILLLPFAAILAYVLWPTPQPPAPPPKKYEVIGLGVPTGGVIDRQTVTFPIGADTFTVPHHYILEHITVDLQFKIGIAWPSKLSIPEDVARRKREGLPPGWANDVLRIQVIALDAEHRREIAEGRTLAPTWDTADSFRFSRGDSARYSPDSSKSDERIRVYLSREKPADSPFTYFELLDALTTTPRGNPVFAVCGRYRIPDDEACYIRYDLNGNQVQLGFRRRHIGDLKEMYQLSRELLNKFREK